MKGICRQQKNVTQKLKFKLERVKTLWEKGENAGYIFSFSLNLSSGFLKAGLCGKQLNGWKTWWKMEKTPHFSFSSEMFSKLFFARIVKIGHGVGRIERKNSSFS